jgi:asparagine synthase (glutamine-hydrolysing)
MPGIFGLITRIPQERAERDLRAMLAVLRLEPFYVAGTWIDGGLGVYAGWTARAGSFFGGMPLSNETGDITLVFSGEEFPDPGTPARLKSLGHDLGTEGPSYLVHLYEEDPNFPKGLNGLFHGLLADRKKGSATLFNDRYGLQRLYYYETTDAFYFAAGAKAILAIRPEVRALNTRSLGEYLTLDCALEDRSLFQGIHVLPAGSAWVFRNGAIERKISYFHPREWEEQEALAPEAFRRELREVFSRTLPRYFQGPERVALSLTGGLDTRMILAWHKLAASLPCYTFGGRYRECRDVTIARRVAKACNRPHEVITVGQGFLTRFPYYAERAIYLSDGCVGVNRAPALYSNQKAREIAPVRMTGNYGDQILRWLRAFRPAGFTSGLFSPELQSHADAARETYQRATEIHPLSFSAFRQVPWFHQGLFALEQSQVAMRSPYLDNELVRTLFRAPAPLLKNNDLRVWMIGEGDPALARIRTDLGFAGRNGFAGAMAQRYHLFTFKAEYAYDHGMPQRLAQIDHLLAPFHLERLFLGRHKFWHFRIWYRDILSGYVREMLLDPRTLSRPYLQAKTLERTVERHLKGARNYTEDIHKVLSLELLHRLFLDGR